MNRCSILLIFILLSAGLILILNAQTEKAGPAAYHKPDEVAAALNSYAAKYPQLAKRLPIGKSASGKELSILQIAAGISSPDHRPAVLVTANLEGAHLIGTEAALRIAEKLLSKYPADKKIAALLETRTIYIAPLLNPDASQNFFATVRYEKFSNSHAVDEDTDGLVDEDGYEDLNKDGVITQMRAKDPEGKWIPDPKEPRLIRLADPKKGEKGLYALYTEGLDNDGDGEYIEDPSGGVELNRNFPHDFEYFVKTCGLYPVSESETIALCRFMTEHPNIALVLNFSTENTLLNFQQTGQAKVGADKVKVPKMYAAFLGLDPETEYTLKEIVDAMKGLNISGGMEITEDMVAMFLGLGPAVTLDRTDQALFEAVQKEYKDVLKSAKLDFLEKRAKGVGKGAFAAYCYYQYGVPVFSADLWTVPEPQKEQPKDTLTADKLKSMTSDEFLALGEEKIDAFLKEQGAPPNVNAKMLTGMVKSGQLKPAQMAEMMEKMPKRPGADGEEHPDAYILKWSDTVLQGKGFVGWTTFKHPKLGDVEIGGFVPYVKINPPPSEIEHTVNVHADFFINLMSRLAEVKITDVKADLAGKDLYRVSALITNPGWFPTSTAQGRRAMTAWPIRVTLALDKDQSLFSGRPAETIPVLNGSGETKKLEWVVRAKKGSRVLVKATSPRLGTAEASIVLN